MLFRSAQTVAPRRSSTAAAAGRQPCPLAHSAPLLSSSAAAAHPPRPSPRPGLMTVSTTASLSTSSAQPPLRPRSQHRPTGDCLPCHARGQTHHHYHEVVARHWGMCRTRTSRTMQLLAKHWHRNMAGVEAVLPLQGGEPGRLQACPQLQPLPNPTRLIKFPIQLTEVLRYSLGNKGESIW